MVSIGSRALLHCDRDEFIAACDEGRWAAAVDAYAGDFLEGFEVGEPAFDRWADAERIRLRSRFQTALRQATTQALETGRLADATQMARRLSAAAPFDEQAVTLEATVLVSAGRSEEAAAVVRQFTQRLHEELELEPSAEIRALLGRLHRTDSRRRTPSDPQDAIRAIPFVGRESELAKLIASLNDLAAERGATVVIQGDAGIGKTRLVDEFVQRARGLGQTTILRGREHSLVSTIPYASIAEALRPLVRAPGVAGTSKHLLAEAARLLPELRDSFELPDVAWVEDDAGRLRFFEGIAALIDAAAYERPVCITLDDMHHASASTLELVSYLAGRLRTSPLLLVVSYRVDAAAPQSGDRLRRLADAAASSERCLILDRLTATDSDRLVRTVAARDDRLSPVVVDRIVELGGGHPMQLIELTRRALAGDAPTSAPIPLRDVLWGRLHATTPSQRRVFFAASLFERHASIPLLAAAAHLPESAAGEAVRALLAAGLLCEADHGVTIAHDASATFVSDASGLAGRAMLADWAAEALSHEPDASDSELANLYALAGRAEKAFEHARKGAFASASMGAMPEAMRLLNAALTFAPDEAARTQIESLVGAFGQPKLRLAAADALSARDRTASPSSKSTERERASEPQTASAIDAPAHDASSPQARPRLTHATARQWMMSIALSLIVVLLGMSTRRELLARRPSANAIDSLVLIERGTGDEDSLRMASGVPGTSPLAMERVTNAAPGPAWVRGLKSPWTAPLIAPNGKLVAVERVTEHGTDVYVISADERDTVAIAIGGRDNTALDWSPDSRRLLVSRGRMTDDGGFDSDLFSYGIDRSVAAIDTGIARSIVDAKWSPTGTRVAWVARVGTSRQEEIFVSAPDGSGLRNLTSNPADDFHPAWSPDGTLLAFTSTRTGARRIFAYDFENARIWPVTDRDGDDRAVFSPDGRYLAFESTRDGDAAVYVSRPLGGTASRITPRGGQFSIAGWYGRRAPYVDRLRIVGPATVALGDITKYSLLALDQYGSPLADVPALWRIDAHGPLSFADSSEADTSRTRTLRGAHAGDEVLLSSIPGWRRDSITVNVSATLPLALHDAFMSGIDASRWISLGAPLPYVGRSPLEDGNALYPNGDLEWDSGVLSNARFPLDDGLTIGAQVDAPFGGKASSATIAIALVPARADSALDQTAPRFSPLLSVSWDGQSGAMTYAVGAQTSTEHAAPGASHALQISIGTGGAVTFSVDGSVRWETSLRYLGDVRGSRVRLWIGGRATGSAIAVTDVDARVAK